MNVKVKVITNAKKDEVKKVDDYLKVYVTAAPEKQKANKRVIETLAKHFEISKSDIELIRGERSKIKTIHFKTSVKL
ncbi:MAG TPA: DUF167 domain-containing protein [Candidatus Omnitrophica bacterium]|nr:DUF167 domain-containing protein [Candidatus Omnitrophota bacterium]